jgi:DNA-binding HxlR family transcriptional regulator
MRKTTSTNALNEQAILDNCGIAYTLKILGGRWKPAILCALRDGSIRYGDIKRKIDGISERMLVAQLKELEKDGIISRTAYPEIPPRVEYTLTPLGETMKPILQVMSDWGDAHRPD